MWRPRDCSRRTHSSMFDQRQGELARSLGLTIAPQPVDFDFAASGFSAHSGGYARHPAHPREPPDGERPPRVTRRRAGNVHRRSAGLRRGAAQSGDREAETPERAEPALEGDRDREEGGAGYQRGRGACPRICRGTRESGIAPRTRRTKPSELCSSASRTFHTTTARRETPRTTIPRFAAGGKSRFTISNRATTSLLAQS